MELMEVLSATTKKTVSESVAMFVAVLFLEIIVFSSLVYAVEVDSNPDFYSILNSAWWCVVTITCVGYGDVYPMSTPGMILGTATLVTGLLCMALVVIIF